MLRPDDTPMTGNNFRATGEPGSVSKKNGKAGYDFVTIGIVLSTGRMR
jgi:hypothetical protein